MKYIQRHPDTNVNVTPTSPLKDFFVLSGGLLVITVAIYFLLGFAVDLIIPHISPETEKKNQKLSLFRLITLILNKMALLS